MSLIKKKEELPIKETVLGAIYGIPGGGKTTVALSMPKPLLLDTDRGLYRVQPEYRTDSVPVEKYQDILDVLNEDLSGYKTIVVDTLGKLVDLISDKVCADNPKFVQPDGTMSLRAWGLIKIEFKNLIKAIEKLNKNFILVAHEKEVMEGDSRIIRPDVSGSAAKDIIKELDFLGYMEVVGKKRSISFSPSSKFYAKNSLGLDSYVEIPILAKGDNNTFLTDYILNPTIERRKNEFKASVSYEEVLKQADEIIAKEGVTEASKDKLRALPKINDSKLQIKDKIDKWEKANAKA